jgi:general stress protein 26
MDKTKYALSMLDKLLKDSKKQLKSALKHKKHPFRYFTLSTLSLNGAPQSRTVVLRDFDSENLILTIFTDSRSKKVEELKEDKRAELLFYDPNQLLQLTIKVNLTESKSSPEKFNQLPEPTKKDYCSLQGPGVSVKGPDAVKYDFEKGYFIKLKFQAYQIEYLKLKRPNHLRAKFLIEDGWQGEFLVP